MSQRFLVKKCGYSRKPWRIVDTYATPTSYGRGMQPEGVEVWLPEVLHLADGDVCVPGPVGFDRKRDAVAWLTEKSALLDAEGS